ncbi:MAG: transporter substrate-binding domain-containing protein [Desulforhopalus sp.]
MLTRHFKTLITTLSLLALLPGLAMSANMTTPSTQPGNGFVDPEGMPSRPLVRDIEPVYRGPGMDTLATIRQRGTMRVGVAVAEPMVMHNAQGELIGFSIDLANKLATDMGVNVAFVETSWTQIIPDLLDKQFDLIISGLWATPTRALVINYSDPTASEGIYLFANKARAAELKTVQDFNQPDVKIAVYEGSIQEQLAKTQFPLATLVVVKGDANQLAPVLEEGAHAALVPTFGPRTIVGLAPDTLALPFPEPISATYAAMGTRKGDPDFLNYLNTWLAFQRDDGWLSERADYWATTTDWLKGE